MSNGFKLILEQASTSAVRFEQLLIYLLLITTFFTGMIFILVVGFSLKYRRRHDDERPAEVHAPAALEAAWIILPLLIALSIFGWGAAVFVNAQHAPANAMEINVVGKQWMWKIQHPDGQREINALHVPTGKPIKLVMTSQDVIHDFGLPAFRIKQDVIPGRYTTLWFTAIKPGTYHIFCDQYCGTKHSAMVGELVVMSPEHYQDWLAGTPSDLSPANAGAKLFVQYSCQTCHSERAPTMAGLYMSKVSVLENGTLRSVTADEAYLRESIVNPSRKIVEGYQPLMPNFTGQLTEEQIMDLLAYIKSLAAPGKADELKMSNRVTPVEPVPSPDSSEQPNR